MKSPFVKRTERNRGKEEQTFTLRGVSLGESRGEFAV
jgi:hypothetical protein